MKSFKHYQQYDQMDCGPTCLRMIAKHHGRSYSMDTLRQKSGINREGVSLLGISEAAEEIGFRTVGVKLTWDQLKKEGNYPGDPDGTYRECINEVLALQEDCENACLSP